MTRNDQAVLIDCSTELTNALVALEFRDGCENEFIASVQLAISKILIDIEKELNK